MSQPRNFQSISFVSLEFTNYFIAAFLEMIISPENIIPWLMTHIVCYILQPPKSLTTYNTYYHRQMVINIGTCPSKRFLHTYVLAQYPSSLESLLVDPTTTNFPRPFRNSSPLIWPSIPYSKPPRTKYQSYKSSCNEFFRTTCSQKTSNQS